MTMPNQTRSAPLFVTAALRVFDLSVGEMLWSRRTIFMALVVGGPMVVAVALRALSAFEMMNIDGAQDGRSLAMTGPSIFGAMVWVLYLRFSVPVLGAFYGTALIADEVEDKTITYLFTRPIARGAVLVGKYLAYLLCATAIVLPSVMLVYFLVVPIQGGGIGENFPSLVVDLAVIAVGLAVYGAVFASVGAWFKRPLLTGLVFVFGWEPVAVLIPGYMKNLTVAYYLQGLVPHAAPQEGAINLVRAMLERVQAPPSLGASLLALLLIWTVSLFVSTRVVEGREYVLDQ